MALDTAAVRSRRALLIGAAGGLAALAAQALGRPLPVLSRVPRPLTASPAGNDDGYALVIGQLRDTMQTTTLRNANTDQTYPEAFLVTNPTNIAIHGVSSDRAALRGDSANHRGGVFSGGKAQVQLLPSQLATHPRQGGKGDLFVDASGRLWFCKGGTTWVKLA